MPRPVTGGPLAEPADLVDAAVRLLAHRRVGIAEQLPEPRQGGSGQLSEATEHEPCVLPEIEASRPQRVDQDRHQRRRRGRVAGPLLFREALDRIRTLWQDGGDPSEDVGGGTAGVLAAVSMRQPNAGIAAGPIEAASYSSARSAGRGRIEPLRILTSLRMDMPRSEVAPPLSSICFASTQRGGSGRRWLRGCVCGRCVVDGGVARAGFGANGWRLRPKWNTDGRGGKVRPRTRVVRILGRILGRVYETVMDRAAPAACLRNMNVGAAPWSRG